MLEGVREVEEMNCRVQSRYKANKQMLNCRFMEGAGSYVMTVVLYRVLNI